MPRLSVRSLVLVVVLMTLAAEAGRTQTSGSGAAATGAAQGGTAPGTLPAAQRIPAAQKIDVGLQTHEGNDAERVEWFRDLGFGMFIHWSVDGQLGPVISHSMVGADEAYLKRYSEELPKTFNPRKFFPPDWAALARLAGMKYVVFTAKHHNGFAMFRTKTTGFGIANTPFERDITGEIVKSFREQGIAPGLYFSPDDFTWLWKNGITLQRNIPEVQPINNPGLMSLAKSQVRELLTNYGPIDLLFFDGDAQGLRDLAWQLQPNVVITRGAMQTPEQYIPGVPLDGPWEACITMGTAWQYQPTGDVYKSGTELIGMLIETRAKGGNLLLNVGPKPDGELPIEQEERLREIGLWMFINGTAIDSVRPWVITNEQDLWFTKKKNTDTVYVFVKEKERWKYGEWKDLVLKSVRATAETQVRVLGQNERVLEYQPAVVPKTTWSQATDGLHIRAMHAQRLNDIRKWPNPIVLELTHVQPALKPPRVTTTEVRWDATAKAAVCEAMLDDLGDAASVQVGCEYQDLTGLDRAERTNQWHAGTTEAQTATGRFTTKLTGLKPGGVYEVRAMVKHPLLTMYGRELRLQVPGPAPAGR
jgi:alpha-L-fucosidase